MKKFIIIICTILILSNCSAFFEFNLFDNLDYINTTRTIENIISSEKSIDENLVNIQDIIYSDSFIEELSKDPDSIDQLVNYLDIVIENGTTEQKQKASALIGDVYAKTSGVEEVTNNILNVVFSGEIKDLSTLLTSIFPEDFYDEDGTIKSSEDLEEPLEDLLTGFYNTYQAYNDFGEFLNPNDIQSLEADVNLGDIAQTVFISSVFYSVIDDVMQTNNTTEQEAISQITQSITSGTELNISENFDLFSNLQEGTGSYNIISLAGLDMLGGTM